MSEDLVHATSSDDLYQNGQLHAVPYPFTAEQEAWLRDLETTDEPQTKQVLHREGMKRGFCCLGRALVVLGYRPEQVGDTCFYDNEPAELPERAAKLLRLRSEVGTLKKTLKLSGDRIEEAFCLVNLNDDAAWSFKQIAAYIRANPWNVFLDPASPQRDGDRPVVPHDEEAA